MYVNGPCLRHLGVIFLKRSEHETYMHAGKEGFEAKCYRSYNRK